MGSLITLDGYELFDGELCVRESCGDKVVLLELGKSFSIKLRLELFQNVGECCERVIESRSAPRYDRKHKTKGNCKQKIKIIKSTH